MNGVRSETDRIVEGLSDGRFGTVEMPGRAMHFTTADVIRAPLYLGLPALVVAHVTVGFICANAFSGTLFGVRNLFRYGTTAFTIILVPGLAVINYAARPSVIAKSSIFVSPFYPGDGDRGPG